MVPAPEQTAALLRLPPAASPLQPCLLPSVLADRSTAQRQARAARSVAPAALHHSDRWCAVLHAAARSRSGFAPEQRGPALQLTVLLPVRCRPHSAARTDPETTNVAVRRTVPVPGRGYAQQSLVQRPRLPAAAPSQSVAPVPPAFLYQTAPAAADRSRTAS